MTAQHQIWTPAQGYFGHLLASCLTPILMLFCTVSEGCKIQPLKFKQERGFRCWCSDRDAGTVLPVLVLSSVFV